MIGSKTITVKKHKTTKYKINTAVVFTLLLIYAFFLFAPFYVIIAQSLTSYEEMTSVSNFVWWPKHISFEGFQIVLSEDPWKETVPTLVLGFFNTLWQTMIPLMVGLLVSGFSAFCFSKIKFPGREKLFLINIATMTMPVGVFGTVGFFFWQALGLSETVWPLILPGLFGGVGTVFFLRMYFDSMSGEILEAAKIDGAGIFRIYLQIAIPCALPAFLSQFIFGFVGGYNSYGGPLLYLIGDSNQWTLQLVISQILGVYSTGYQNAVCASALMGMIPLIILYAFLQKWFLEGIAVGGGKE